LFIDDIQWMGDGSRHFLTFLLNDQGLTNILVVLAYCDEVNRSIANFLDELGSFPNVVDVGLHNLDVEAVCQLVSEIIGCRTSSTEELSDIIEAKTRGNPFHVVQFLEAIQREGFMTYNINPSTWFFDVDKIQLQIMISETLADLLALRVKRLPLNVQESLKIASLLGYCFDQAILNQIALLIIDSRDKLDSCDVSTAALSLDSIASSLNEAKKEGFIERIKGGFQLSHDKLQMAFASMIDKEQRGKYHLIIGKTYLSKESPESLYYAAVHLHQAPSHMSKGIVPVNLAQINLQAAKYCRKMRAFNDAAILLRRGLELLDPEEKWTTHHDLAFELTEILSKMELIIGNHKSCKEKARAALF
jgi:predicted ATPase